MDCLEGCRKLPDNSIDLIITDPPYNFIAYGGGFYDYGKVGARTYLTKLKKLKCDKYAPSEFLKEAKRILKKFNFVVFCNKFLIKDYINFAVKNSFNFDIHCLIKKNPIPAKQNHFLHNIEYIVVIREKGATFNLKCNLSDYEKYYITTSKQNKLHPAQKPVELIRKYIRVLSKEGDIVLDGYGGSGTTYVACKQLNRKFIGFEINKEYCEIAKKRLAQQILK
jgi:DNA modification methylase